MRRFSLMQFMVLLAVVGCFRLAGAVELLAEGFEDVPNLHVNGWHMLNKSKPLGATDWFNGDVTLFPAQSGAANSYIAANNTNTSGKGTISNWLLTPVLDFSAISQISFYTRTVDKPVAQDRLQIRLSTNGNSIDIGSSETDVGDFKTVLVEINPDLATGGYPSGWTRYVIEGASLPASGAGRIAFRYFVTDGGPDGTNSDYIGIDTFEAKAGTKGGKDQAGGSPRPGKN